MSSETIFRQIFKDLKENGKECSPRGQKVIEIENYKYVLPGRVRFCNFEARKLNLDYVKKEFLWYLRGNKYDLEILNHASMWKSLVNDDLTINSNYGQYIFATNNSGFGKVVKTLIDDRDSRRASIMILNNYHLSSNTKDYPCTYSLNFRIRDDMLNMTVHMRSQDAIFGMGNDAPCFSFIHEMVFSELQLTYPELKLGEYCHFADSFHVYERHFEMLDELADNSKYNEVACPIIVPGEAWVLINEIHFSGYLSNQSSTPDQILKGFDDASMDTNTKLSNLKEACEKYPALNKLISHSVNCYNFSKWLTTFSKETK